MSLAFSIQTAATEAGLSPRWIHHLIKTRALPAVRVGKRVLVLREDLELFLQGRKTVAQDSQVADELVASR